MSFITLLENLDVDHDIEDVFEQEITFDNENIETDKICEILTDFMRPLKTRLLAIDLYYHHFGEKVIEVLKRLVSLFMISNSFLIEEYICLICLQSNINLTLKLETAKDLCLYGNGKNYSVLSTLISESEIIPENLEDEVPIPMRVSAICELMTHSDYKTEALKYMTEIINNNWQECEYRYKIILSLKTIFDMKKQWVKDPLEIERLNDNYLFFEKSCLVGFLSNIENSLMYRILCGQTLLQRYRESIEDLLLDISYNSKNNYNSRADAADVVLRYGRDDFKSKAKTIIRELGKTGENNTIYNNAQNAHTEEIESSALESLIRLSEEPLAKNDMNLEIDFDFVENKINAMTKYENICIALNRIRYDNALYSHLHFSLKSALVYVYSFIMKQSLDDQESLLKRLLQELDESADICSTGIMERIVNTLSGFSGDYGLRISFQDQITANLNGRLNLKIRNLSLPTTKCLHKTNEKFCDCFLDVCYASKCLIGDAKIYGSDLKVCGNCISCLKIKCNHQCEKQCEKQCESPSNNINTCPYNQDLMAEILEQMLIPTHKYHLRGKFLLFFRTYLSEILDDIQEDFVDGGHMDITTFDLYFRKAVIQYEGEM